ncbi:Arc family DNA-binding protein [uncultured Pseudacidovorax sp.]|uniref:Arc family DNA-binding protein n=1 Tax=uncultured Pseudacidovorax sp. TaxID=679313 RepID=UPI0025F0A694|nr:Arc family DNA-binding protein [uncultured Pseudacidovorax sp.]
MATRLEQSDFVKTALRLPPDVHAQIHAAADASGRSFNAEILARLQDSLARPAASDLQAIRRVVREELAKALTPR